VRWPPEKFSAEAAGGVAHSATAKSAGRSRRSGIIRKSFVSEFLKASSGENRV
jgi:hypothetical protein